MTRRYWETQTNIVVPWHSPLFSSSISSLSFLLFHRYSSEIIMTVNIGSESGSTNWVFIGGGNMAAALIKGCEKKNFVEKHNIAVSVQTGKSAEKWRKQGYDNVFTNTLEMLETYPTAIYIICVKPQVFDEVVSSWPVNSRPKFIISVMAGVPLKTLSEKLPFVSGNTTIVRLMPNVASSIGFSASTMCYEKNDKIENQEVFVECARKFAECVGTVELIPERCFNPAMAIGGSSPAWTFMYIESLADGAVAQGLGRAEAKRLAAQAVVGAAQMLLDSESGFNIESQHFGLLKDKVCSPGGTTIEGVRTLEKNGFRSAVLEAVVATSKKADDMAKSLSK
uniref:Pyrroline-5-carboxylate reductase n=2 Tax=Caenorhabditis tropicalis TaxID=1561998 RepID=A0A1I7V0G1_9PELO